MQYKNRPSYLFQLHTSFFVARSMGIRNKPRQCSWRVCLCRVVVVSCVLCSCPRHAGKLQCRAVSRHIALCRHAMVELKPRLLDGVVCVVAGSHGEAVMPGRARGSRKSLSRMCGSCHKGRTLSVAPGEFVAYM